MFGEKREIRARVEAALLGAAYCDPKDPDDVCPVLFEVDNLRTECGRHGVDIDAQAASRIGDMAEAVLTEVALPSPELLQVRPSSRADAGSGPEFGPLFEAARIERLCTDERGLGPDSETARRAARAGDRLLGALVGATVRSVRRPVIRLDDVQRARQAFPDAIVAIVCPD